MKKASEENDIPILSAQCSFCIHNNPSDGPVCEAFPDGIPLSIWVNETKHDHSIEGDHGLQFKYPDEIQKGYEQAEAELKERQLSKV